MRFLLVIALAALLLLAGGCGGGDESSGVKVIPAAGDQTPPSDRSVETYDIKGNEYLELEKGGALTAAGDYVDDHPDECEGADPKEVEAYATVSIGADYPLTALIGEVLAEGCAADLQTGSAP